MIHGNGMDLPQNSTVQRLNWIERTQTAEPGCLRAVHLRASVYALCLVTANIDSRRRKI